ncbi:MAG: cation-translocating P-type ATPase [bacterium]|nr:cation-translocating P-type ATPase [bacterium]
MHSGLTTAQAEQSRAKHGLNVLVAGKKNSVLLMIFDQFTDLMVMILIVSATIAIGMGVYLGEEHSLIDGLVILGIVIVNAGIGFLQEYKTEKALEALKKLVAPSAMVMRNGHKEQIKAEELVPGDIVCLSPGDKIPADGKVIDSSSLKVEESALTGESVPVGKEEKDLVFMGTTAVAGTALVEITATGMATEFGKIAHLTTTTIKESSPLQKELLHVGVFVTKITVALSGILIVVGIFVQGKGFLESLLFGVAVAVAAVPEGLPATITIALALGVQELARRKALVKKLSSVETLGSTTVICTDKTGTLTRNEMTVTKLLLGNEQAVEVSGVGYDPNEGVILAEKFKNHWAEENLAKIRLISTYCTGADLQKQGSHFKILGDPTEGALLTLAQKKVEGSGQKPDIPKWTVVKEIPFDSDRKLMSVVAKNRDQSLELLTKGSPDELLKRCTHILTAGGVKLIDDEEKEEIKQQNETMAKEALRVIGFAYRPLEKVPPLGRDLERELVFVGLAGMIDPPRSEVKKAVSLCHKAGIRTIIITGDHGLTAKAVAMNIGLAGKGSAVILGEEVGRMKDGELDVVLRGNIRRAIGSGGPQHSLIFSRVSPQHKCRIVDRLMRMGEVVAVTGDGVNDAPALKRADLGIAMGITGTEVSKETANMILLDDSFASIVTAVREGRKIYANLRKFVWFIFSTNIGELVTICTAILLQIPAPLTASLILAINVGTDIFPAIALGVDHAEPGVMKKPPRDPRLRIMNRDFVTHFVAVGMFMGLLVLAVYLWKLSSLGWNWGETMADGDPRHLQAATLAFASLVVIQLFNAFNARSFQFSAFTLKSLKQLWIACGLSVLMVLAMVYLPFFQRIFQTSSLSMNDWLVVFGCGLAVLAVEEGRKLVTSRT